MSNSHSNFYFEDSDDEDAARSPPQPPPQNVLESGWRAHRRRHGSGSEASASSQDLARMARSDPGLSDHQNLPISPPPVRRALVPHHHRYSQLPPPRDGDPGIPPLPISHPKAPLRSRTLDPIDMRTRRQMQIALQASNQAMQQFIPRSASSSSIPNRQSPFSLEAPPVLVAQARQHSGPAQSPQHSSSQSMSVLLSSFDQTSPNLSDEDSDTIPADLLSQPLPPNQRARSATLNQSSFDPHTRRRSEDSDTIPAEEFQSMRLVPMSRRTGQTESGSNEIHSRTAAQSPDHGSSNRPAPPLPAYQLWLQEQGENEARQNARRANTGPTRPTRPTRPTGGDQGAPRNGFRGLANRVLNPKKP
ncbi:hypothetical protein OIO90_004712 [Microbotryomycetes sp. JL221]|nr:hypothetical protein OIO90_004712 [Microbotryomycetes sp. JL221]